jgi:acyl-CoA thioesterase-1
VAILLCGMYAPRNMGADFTKAFDAIYPALAKEHGILLYPFFLEGVAGRPALNQADGIHPTAQGIAVIVENIYPSVLKLLKTVQ